MFFILTYTSVLRVWIMQCLSSVFSMFILRLSETCFCGTFTKRLYSVVPGSWTLECVCNVSTNKGKSVFHLFFDVVEDVANAREGGASIGIKHRGSHDLWKYMFNSYNIRFPYLSFDICSLSWHSMDKCKRHINNLLVHALLSAPEGAPNIA